MLGVYYEFPKIGSSLVISQVRGMPTTDEFQQQIEQHETQAYQYFALIMGVTVVISFLKGLI